MIGPPLNLCGNQDMRFKIALAALAATAAFASPAFAQTRYGHRPAEARGLVLQPLTLSRSRTISTSAPSLPAPSPAASRSTPTPATAPLPAACAGVATDSAAARLFTGAGTRRSAGRPDAHPAGRQPAGQRHRTSLADQQLVLDRLACTTRTIDPLRRRSSWRRRHLRHRRQPAERSLRGRFRR